MRLNARRNGVAGLVRATVSDGFRARAVGEGAPYALVLANILARPLKRMAPNLARHLAPGGAVVLSGLLEQQERQVLAAHLPHGLVLAARRASRAGRPWCWRRRNGPAGVACGAVVRALQSRLRRCAAGRACDRRVRPAKPRRRRPRARRRRSRRRRPSDCNWRARSSIAAGSRAPLALGVGIFGDRDWRRHGSSSLEVMCDRCGFPHRRAAYDPMLKIELQAGLPRRPGLLARLAAPSTPFHGRMAHVTAVQLLSARSAVRRDAGPSQGPRDDIRRSCTAARRVAFRAPWRASAPLADVAASPARRFLPRRREKTITCTILP